MSESREPEDQDVAQLAEDEQDASEHDDDAGWDDCALFRARAMSLSREELAGYIYQDAGDCIEQCVMALWDTRHEMGAIWTVTEVLLKTWGEASQQFSEAWKKGTPSTEEAASDLLDQTNQVYYHARVWADAFDVAFPYLLERELLEVGVAELLSRRYFDKVGLKAERDALACANQGLHNSIRHKAHKKTKVGQAHDPGSKRKEVAAR